MPRHPPPHPLPIRALHSILSRCSSAKIPEVPTVLVSLSAAWCWGQRRPSFKIDDRPSFKIRRQPHVPKIRQLPQVPKIRRPTPSSPRSGAARPRPPPASGCEIRRGECRIQRGWCRWRAKVTVAPPPLEDPATLLQDPAVARGPHGAPKSRRSGVRPSFPKIPRPTPKVLSLYLYLGPEPTRCPFTPGHFPFGAYYSVFSPCEPHVPSPIRFFSEYEHVLPPPSNHPDPDFFTAPLSDSFFHYMDCIVRFCVKGNIFT
jgi:hypothetical protein